MLPQYSSVVNVLESQALCTAQRMRPDYKEHYRATAVGYILTFAARLSVVDDYAHDAVLLMDRAMSTCMQVRHRLLCFACIPAALRHGTASTFLISSKGLCQILKGV